MAQRLMVMMMMMTTTMEQVEDPLNDFILGDFFFFCSC